VSADTGEEFKKLLLQTIDDSFKEIFGETATHIIYFYLESNCSLRREDIPDRLEDFMEGLHKFFSKASVTVEHAVLTKLYSSLGLKFERREGQGFVDYVDELKNVYQVVKKSAEEQMVPKTARKSTHGR